MQRAVSSGFTLVVSTFSSYLFITIDLYILTARHFTSYYLHVIIYNYLHFLASVKWYLLCVTGSSQWSLRRWCSRILCLRDVTLKMSHHWTHTLGIAPSETHILWTQVGLLDLKEVAKMTYLFFFSTQLVVEIISVSTVIYHYSTLQWVFSDVVERATALYKQN